MYFRMNILKRFRTTGRKYNWITGDPVEEGEAEEGVTIHHWPTKLVLLNVKNVDYQKIEKELQAFRKVHKEDERFDKDVLSCYSKRTTMEQIESERFMTTVVDIFIMGAFLLGSVLVIYLKYESEMTDKKKRNHFLTCIGMSSKEREKLIRTETGIFFLDPGSSCGCYGAGVNRGDMEHAGIYEG